jgi:hypothetical protein
MKEYETKLKEERQYKKDMAAGIIVKEAVVFQDVEIFLTTRRMMYKEAKESNSVQKGFLNAGTRVAVRKTELLPQFPPLSRMLVAVPGAITELGWIDEFKGEEPSLSPEVPTPAPASAPTADAVADAPAEGSWSWFSGIGDAISKLGEAVVGAMALRKLFGGDVDLSDAGLAKSFKAVDADGGGSISREEMKRCPMPCALMACAQGPCPVPCMSTGSMPMYYPGYACPCFPCPCIPGPCTCPCIPCTLLMIPCTLCPVTCACTLYPVHDTMHPVPCALYPVHASLCLTRVIRVQGTWCRAWY